MWKTTGDVKWRKRGYAIFQAIEKHTRSIFGYTSVNGVSGGMFQLNDMPRLNSPFFPYQHDLDCPCFFA